MFRRVGTVLGKTLFNSAKMFSKPGELGELDQSSGNPSKAVRSKFADNELKSNRRRDAETLKQPKSGDTSRGWPH